MNEERRFEPWPFVLALALLAMMGISLSFYAVAHMNPDPPVAESQRAPLPADGR